MLTAALAGAACGADDPETGVADVLDADRSTEGGLAPDLAPATIVVANSPGTLTTSGPQRVLVALVGERPNEFIGGGDQPAVIEFQAVDGASAGEVRGEWLSNPGVALGLYVATFTFDEPGLWEIGVKGANEEIAAALVEVGEDSTVPQRGDPAPRSASLTATTAEGLALITTDPDPDPRFYELSIAEAVANGRPTVIVFATPAFCRTAICGPTVEIAKAIADRKPDVDFVHVEPFDIEAARAGSLEPIDLMFEWGLVTEPWVFVVDEDGVISAAFEGIVGETELEAAIDRR